MVTYRKQPRMGRGCKALQETLLVHAAALKKFSQTQFNWSFRFFVFVFAKCVFLLVCIFNNGFIEIQLLYHLSVWSVQISDFWCSTLLILSSHGEMYHRPTFKLDSALLKTCSSNKHFLQVSFCPTLVVSRTEQEAACLSRVLFSFPCLPGGVWPSG